MSAVVGYSCEIILFDMGHSLLTNREKMKDSLIIVSGGMDSITLLYDRKESIALALTFDYGSNHAQKEIPFARLHSVRIHP